jgi:hypothetical protein
LDQASILLDACHEDVSSTMTYLGDLGTLKALVKRINPNNIHHHVGRYEPIYVKVLDNFGVFNMEQASEFHTTNVKDLGQLSDWYISTVLNLKSSDMSRFSIANLFNMASQWYTPDLTLETEVDLLLKERLKPEEYIWAKESLNKTKREQARAIMNHESWRGFWSSSICGTSID